MVAAHAKLKQLQAWRRQHQVEYSLCVNERDTALREIEKLKFYAAEQSDELEHAQRLTEAQAQLIRELRVECAAVRKNSKRPVRAKAVDADGPALTVQAVKKLAGQIDYNKHATGAVESALSTGPIVSLFRRIGRRMSSR